MSEFLLLHDLIFIHELVNINTSKKQQQTTTTTTTKPTHKTTKHKTKQTKTYKQKTNLEKYIILLQTYLNGHDAIFSTKPTQPCRMKSLLYI